MILLVGQDLSHLEWDCLRVVYKEFNHAGVLLEMRFGYLSKCNWSCVYDIDKGLLFAGY